ncbi:MAG: hypothetical protein AAGF02_16245 [Actinomycetota bacterium]
MRASDYLQALKRRWFVILLAVDIGLVAGWVLTSEEVPVETDRFAATATLVTEADGITPGQVVLAMTTGEIIDSVAAQFGTEPDLLLEQVTFTPDAELRVVEIEALGPEASRVANLPNAFAAEIVALLDERAQLDQQERRDELVTRQEELRQRVAELDGLLVEEVRRVEEEQLAGDVAAAVDPLLVAERNSFVNQYSLAVEQFQQLATEDIASGGVTILQDAIAEPISGPEFRRRLEEAQSRGEQVSAPAPPEPASKVQNAAIGGLVGLVLSIALVLGLRRIDSRILSRDEAAEAFGLPVIGEIPKLSWSRRRRRELLMLTRPRSRYAEAYRSVRTALLIGAAGPAREAAPEAPANGNGHGTVNGHANGNGAPNGNGHGNGHASPGPSSSTPPGVASGAVVLVTSPMATDGKTTTAASLAIAFAEEGRRVLLIDADFRRGELRKSLDVTPAVVLADVPPDEFDVHYPNVLTSTATDGLSLAVTAFHDDGQDSPPALIALQRRLIERAHDDFEIIVVDTAPVLASNDAADLLPSVDVVVMVGRCGRTKKSWARQASEAFDRLGAPFAGVVYVGDPQAETAYSYYAGSSRRSRRRPVSPKRSEPASATGDDADADRASDDELAAPGEGPPDGGDVPSDEPTRTS